VILSIVMSAKKPHSINRRDMLKLGALSLGALTAPLAPVQKRRISFPDYERLGRIAQASADVYPRPDATSSPITRLYEDTVLPWYREVVGYHPYRVNQRWVETPEGYIWSGGLQPVRDQPNQPLDVMPESDQGTGMWVVVTVPWVDIFLENPPARSPSLKENPNPRLYYSQILWADEIRTSSYTGLPLYRLTEKYGYGDVFLADARAFRPLAPDDLTPISPDVTQKRIDVDVTRQSMSCYEGETEVYYCRVSTGAKFNAAGEAVDEWATPIGEHPIWRKVISLHMSGGTTGGGYDLPGIGWSTLFVGNGVAIHSTFWHNNFGVPMSHGCVNAKPADAHFIFRWTTPFVPYDPGDVTISMPGGTRVRVIES
jgi:hypothetical protein